MNNRNWLKSNSQQRQLFVNWITCSWRRMLALLGLFACAVIWIALALSLTGCAHNSPSPCPEQKLPPAPALSEPIPPVSYSLRAQRSLSKWEASLIESTQTGRR